MKKIIFSSISIVLALSLIMISCSKGGGYGTMTSNPPPAATVNTVNIVGMTYDPATITVTVGTTITWNNNDNMAHTVTADDNSFDSGNIAAGGKFSKQFTVAGTYAYHCTIHAGMKATVIVK